MWRGTCSLGSATRGSGKSGKSLATSPISGESTHVDTGGMTTAIVWYRRDLRVHDHPALARAAREFDRVIPLFVLDPALAGLSPARTAFMHACLRALDGELRERGAGLVVREGRPAEVLAGLKADAILATSEV